MGELAFKFAVGGQQLTGHAGDPGLVPLLRGPQFTLVDQLHAFLGRRQRQAEEMQIVLERCGRQGE